MQSKTPTMMPVSKRTEYAKKLAPLVKSCVDNPDMTPKLAELKKNIKTVFNEMKAAATSENDKNTNSTPCAGCVGLRVQGWLTRDSNNVRSLILQIIGIQKNEVKNKDWYKEFNIGTLCTSTSESMIAYTAQSRAQHTREDTKLVITSVIHSKFESILEHGLKFQNPVSCMIALAGTRPAALRV